MKKSASSIFLAFLVAAALVGRSLSSDTGSRTAAGAGKESFDDGDRPNIVFLVVESTDGRTWQRGYSNDAIPLPNMRDLEDRGATSFYRHYSNAPVCCPSRATFWSGRHAHHIRHMHHGIEVDGAYNNYEGLPANFSDRIDQVLSRSGYDTLVSGKRDWDSGSHSENVYLNAWTMYSQFPYNVSANGGWRDENPWCRDNGTVLPGNKSAHEGDWKVLRNTTAWIRDHSGDKPFFVYQGMNIVHPPYVTSEEYYDMIDPDKVDVPEWPPLESLHPCDLQSSMLKGCLPTDEEADEFYSVKRRRNIRRIYYAMIAEFDRMVGEYVAAVRDAGVEDNTVFVITSDHGDMNMIMQQHYKMVPREGSASVPMIIFDGRAARGKNRVVREPTQLIDIMPTMLEIARVDEKSYPPGLDGYSLVPLLADRPAQDDTTSARPLFVVSQFHGDNIAMSWFSVVQGVQCLGDQTCMMKLIKWGTGKEVPDQLFDLSHDPDESRNLIDNPDFRSIAEELEASLRSVIDYPSVAMDVAHYGKESFEWWVNKTGSAWKKEIHKEGLRWTQSWDWNVSGSFGALAEWRANPPRILPCRASLTFP